MKENKILVFKAEAEQNDVIVNREVMEAVMDGKIPGWMFEPSVEYAISDLKGDIMVDSENQPLIQKISKLFQKFELWIDEDRLKRCLT